MLLALRCSPYLPMLPCLRKRKTGKSCEREYWRTAMLLFPTTTSNSSTHVRMSSHQKKTGDNTEDIRLQYCTVDAVPLQHVEGPSRERVQGTEYCSAAHATPRLACCFLHPLYPCGPRLPSFSSCKKRRYSRFNHHDVG